MSDIIGDDGLPITLVGKWTVEKHERLVKYIDISQDARRKFQGETTYIELFCGPGRSKIRETGQLIDGSPLHAAREAKKGRAPFKDIHLADAQKSYVEAVCKRMPRTVGQVHPYAGEADSTINDIVSRLNRYGLHFAFLDPYKLDLPFSIIESLAKFRHMDMLIHVSIHDLQRNLRRYMDEQNGPLDRFAPGWRETVRMHGIADRNVRIAIFNHWLSLIRKLDMAASEGDEIVRVVGSKRQPLYWLVLVARHPLAHKFWNAIRNVGEQHEFNFSHR
jgi:three-Cys-motif partner protein